MQLSATAVTNCLMNSTSFFFSPLNVPEKVEEVSSGTTLSFFDGDWAPEVKVWSRDLKKNCFKMIFVSVFVHVIEIQYDFSIRRGVEIHNTLYSEENGP